MSASGTDIRDGPTFKSPDPRGEAGEGPIQGRGVDQTGRFAFRFFTGSMMETPFS